MAARFDGRVAIVTGAGSGIGRATVVALAAEGATVAAAAGRSSGTLAETVRLAEEAGGRAVAHTTDVTRGEDVARLVATVAERYGRLDVAVNNAGAFGRVTPVADLAQDVWDEVVATNLTGTFLSMKYEIGYMREHGGGVIVNVSSNIGVHSRRQGMAAYTSSKAGVSALTRVAARDHIGDGVRVNAVSPGPSDTPMSMRPGETEADRAERLRTAVPIGRVGALDEITATVLWLASDESSFVVGHDLVVDGGATA